MHHSGETLLISFHASSIKIGHYHLLPMITILAMKICIAPWRANQKILCLFCFYQFYATLHEQTCREILELNLDVPMTSHDMKSPPPSQIYGVCWIAFSDNSNENSVLACSWDKIPVHTQTTFFFTKSISF